MVDGGSGLFLSLLDYTIKKHPLLADAVKTLPRNATYTCHDIQNELIGLLSDVVTESIVKEVGNSYYTLKVDGTRDPTGCKNMSIVIQFVKEYESCKVVEFLLTIATTEMGDAQTLTDTILAVLHKAGLNASKILSKVYDVASLMSGKITSLLTEIDSVRAHGPELRMEAVGLLREMTASSFLFIANFVHEVLALLDPPSKLLQREDTDLWAGLSIVASAKHCVQKLRCDEGFTKVWEKALESASARASLTTPKRKRTANKTMFDYLVEETTGQRDYDIETELKRLYYSTVDSVIEEMDKRFGERNTHLYHALATIDPESESFLDPETVKHIIDLTQSPIVKAEFEVAKQFLRSVSDKESDTDREKWTTRLILSKDHNALQTMPSVLIALKHALACGASTATHENSFSSLRNVFTDHRCSMLHKRKAQLVQLTFEKDLT
ncbi:hypothetical protein IRJ41_012057 [Triplophysa rosa]|uniref:HAT C-terminal dimerisation domain-containing protein n=1 Tax=Triplophysa rosa TaxID=992332 RepID=A0A9W7X2P4_TRIRA|nr:hypothetical protein IRJ41_012057 [Triplophysa rosa]